MRRYVMLLATGMLAIGAMSSVACSDRDAAESKSGQLVALSIIDAAEFHAMDGGLNQAGGVIDPQWLGRVRHGQTAVASVSWPDERRASTRAFVDAAQDVATALEADDAQTAAPAAKEAHEAQHELSTEDWVSLAATAGIKVAGHTDASPTATATPQGRQL